jgi:hypothetical protein
MVEINGIEIPDEEVEFMQQAGTMFNRASELVAEAGLNAALENVLFSGTVILILKAWNRSAHNVRLEWDIDRQLFIEDALTQAKRFILHVRDNLVKYPITSDSKEVEEARRSTQLVVKAMIWLLAKKEFIEWFDDFVAETMTAKEVLEHKFIRPE